jgi:cob(I)alamin adenosyltransferase
MRMPKSEFYTRRGDDGYTGLLGPDRVPKYDLRPEAYGTVDEAQAILGLVRVSDCSPRTNEILFALQGEFYTLMAELAAAGDPDSPFAGNITNGHIDQIEAWLAEVEAQVDMPMEFVIPGDSRAGAALHLARTVVRRAERRVARMRHEDLLANEQVLRYLNRLSSLLFVLALLEDGRVTGRKATLAKEAQPEPGQG